MKRRTKQVITILSIFLAIIALTSACSGSSEPTATPEPTTEEEPTSEPTTEEGSTSEPTTEEGSTSEPTTEEEQTDKIQLGMYEGRVTYDPEEDYYFIEARGARFPFKTDPREALKVLLEAPGEDIVAKYSALLLGMIGEGVLHTTILINPDEEDALIPAVNDLALYLQIANPRKFAGLAYTKPGGKIENSVIKGPQIQSLDVDATPQTTIVQIKGPQSGAQSTAVRVLGDGKFVIEGETYEETWRAADFVSLTLLKMLCGSPDCPDAAVCATGGDCGC